MRQTGIAFLILLITNPATGFSQKILCSAQIPVTQIYTNRIGNILILNNDGIFSFNDSCRQTNSFTGKVAGGIQSLDASNPLKLLAFSKGQNTIFIFDDKLHLQTSIDLKQVGVLLPAVVCNSRNDGFRLYDQAQRKLIRFNFNLVKDADIELNLPGISRFEPVMMMETESNIYISNPPEGIHVFDRFSNYLKTVPCNESGNFTVADNRISYVKNGMIISFDADAFNPVEEEVKFTTAKSGFLFFDKIFEADEKGFTISLK